MDIDDGMSRADEIAVIFIAVIIGIEPMHSGIAAKPCQLALGIMACGGLDGF